MASGRAERLASAFERVNTEVAAAVAGCTDADWQRPCLSEGRSVAVVAYHIANGYAFARDVAEASAAGTDLPPHIGRNAEQAAHINAIQAEEQANCTRAEVLALLDRNATAVAAFIRGLTDAQLDRAPGFPLGATTQAIIERVVIGHARGHLGKIVLTLAG